MAGIAVVNTQASLEYKEIVEKYKIGYNSSDNDLSDLVVKMKRLIKNKKLRDEMGRNNRNLAEEKFDRKKTYNQIVKIIEGN